MSNPIGVNVENGELVFAAEPRYRISAINIQLDLFIEQCGERFELMCTRPSRWGVSWEDGDEPHRIASLEPVKCAGSGEVIGYWYDGKPFRGPTDVLFYAQEQIVESIAAVIYGQAD